MRVVTFEVPSIFGNATRVGALDESERVIDLEIACIAARTSTDAGSSVSSMERFITAGESALDAARRAMDFAANESDLRGPSGHRAIFDIDNVHLKAPLSHPNSLRDFLAFEDHAKAGATRRQEELNPIWYERPIYYKGNHRSIYGPDDVIVRPGFTRELDFELEIACIVGANGRNLSEPDAESAIFGFTIMNDWSARDLQRTEMATRLGPAKSKDFATSLGPWIVTFDEVGHRPALDMSARVNGRVLCEANLEAARWTFASMIAYVSRDEGVWATDVYGSGTPFGGCLLDHGGPYLEPGDVVELEVERLGVLRNRVG